MKKDIILPDLGEGIEKAEVSEVTVSVGDNVAKDDTLLVLESDKASMEIPAEEPGRVLEVLVSAGEEVSKGQLLARVETEDSVVPEVKGKNKKPSREKREAEVSPPPKIDRVPVEIKKGEGVFASPGVRRLARELNIDLNIISGSGPKGRTTKDDLHAHIKLRMDMAAGKTGPIKKEIDFSRWGDVETQKLTRINKITGSRIQEAWQEIPRVTQYDSADITELDALRKELKKVQIGKNLLWNQSLIEYLELVNMIDTAELMTHAALERDGSVGGHVRADCKDLSIFSKPYSTLVKVRKSYVEVSKIDRKRTELKKLVEFKFKEQKRFLEAKILRLLPMRFKDAIIEKRYKKIMGSKEKAPPLEPGSIEAAVGDQKLL